jgi:hypothetical protein
MSISSIPLGDLTKARIVYMILNKRTEEALEHPSNLYNTVTPEIVDLHSSDYASFYQLKYHYT